ncbi:hypothetical protein ACJRPK_16410 [Aquimarina sp. 2-A2]|uniref:hypothetical protein n=1 Tax=Aquimarina sp. 2-A2 TaxID=3382644 RepID=UPI00387F0D68
MKVEYPIVAEDLINRTDVKSEIEKESIKDRYYGHSNQFGFFPIGRLNSWHGGIHIEYSRVVRAIADGRIIAYRLTEDYLTEKDTGRNYSNSFILIQHNFETPEKKKLRFYSLYMHLKPKKTLEKESGNYIPDCFAKYIVTTKKDLPKLGLKVRKFDESHISKDEATEFKFVTKGDTLTKSKIKIETLPEKHWLRQKKGKKYRLFELDGSTVCAFTGWLQPVDETTSKVIYVKKEKGEFDSGTFDKSGAKGTMLFDAIEGCYVGMECKDVELEVEKTKNPNWYKVKKTGQYVLKRDCTAIKKKVSDTVKVNKIDDTSVQNVDILIKAGEVVGVPSKFAFEKQSHYNAMHLEVFTDDEGVSKFIDNKEDKGRTTYEVPADKSLKLATPCDFLNANTKVKIYQQGDHYTQIGFESIKNIVLPVKGNIYTKDEDGDNGEKGYETAPKGYHVYDFKVVNEYFSNALEEGISSILWMASDNTKDNPTRTVKYIHPKAGQKFWVPNDKVSGTKGAWVALSKPITSYYDKDPMDTDKGIKIEEPTPIRKIETFEDSTNKTKWWKVQGKGKEKDKKGWIKYDDLTKKNPYQWETLGWKLKEDTGTQYFYQFGDYVNESEPHQFINDIWELVDTDKDKVLSVRELQRCMSDEVKIAKLSKLICKHSSEWNMSQNFDTFKQEIEAIYAKGIEQEEEEGQRQDLETARDEKIALLKEKIEKLSFWDKIQDGPITEKTTDTSKKEEPSRFSIMQETTALKQAQHTKKQEAKVPKRTFPVSNDNVYHFHPIAFVEHMKLIVGDGGKMKSVLEEMKLLVDKHIPYSQQGERSSLSDEGMAALDCSETVGIYLHKLGCMPKYKAIHTGIMTTEADFRKAIGSNKVQLVEGSDKADFIPESGDIFVWRRKRVKKDKNGNEIVKYDGHTGIVYKYEEIKDVVWILEAIGSGGASGESQQVKNGGHSGIDCTRTAIYNKNSKALNRHDGWVGYYRPINY